MANLPARRFSRAEIAEALEVWAESSSLDETITKLSRIWPETPSRSTISKWKRVHPELHERAQEGVEQRRKARIRGTRYQIVEQSGSIILEGLGQLAEAVQNREIPPRELAMVVKAVTVTWGIGDDHAVRADGMPTSIVEHRETGEEILNKLRARGVLRDSDVDSDAEEVD